MYVLPWVFRIHYPQNSCVYNSSMAKAGLSTLIGLQPLHNHLTSCRVYSLNESIGLKVSLTPSCVQIYTRIDAYNDTIDYINSATFPGPVYACVRKLASGRTTMPNTHNYCTGTHVHCTLNATYYGTSRVFSKPTVHVDCRSW